MQQAILDFWFGPAHSPQHGATRSEWFRKDDGFDADIRARFGDTVQQAIAGSFDDWRSSPRGSLALVIALDQFPRNILRHRPEAFAGDGRALAVATAAVDGGQDRVLLPVERWFLYLPFEHSENAKAQERALALFTKLRDDSGLDEPLKWAKKHAAVIRRFGRYPHRNAILGRASTPDEAAFLREPGSSF